MWKNYEKFDLIKDKYYIEYIYNKEDGAFARIWFLESLKPRTSKEIGILTTYFEESPPEDVHAHWLAECYMSSEHFKAELIDAIGEELLRRTSCKEPFLLNVCKGERIHGQIRKYGELYTSEFYN